jgi:hypothetical protein
MQDLRREWLPKILAIAEMISDGALEARWTDGLEHPTRSIIRLKFQVFDLLRFDEVRWEMRRQLMAFPSLIEELEIFLHCLRTCVSEPPSRRAGPFSFAFARQDPATRLFLGSEYWADLKDRAAAVLAAARAAGCEPPASDTPKP